MITVCIDIGSVNIKAVVLKENQILSRLVVASDNDAETATQKALDQVLLMANLTSPDIKNVGFTASVSESLSFVSEKRVTHILSTVKGVKQIIPSAEIIMDIGAETIRLIKVDQRGRVLDFITNDKCASGTGYFFEAVSKILNIPLDTLGDVFLNASDTVPVTSTCVVFAESEIISLIHRGVPIPSIVAGIFEAMSSRIAGMLNRMRAREAVVAIGGVAKNRQLMDLVQTRTGVKIIVPSEPDIISALGAALVARERITSGEK